MSILLKVLLCFLISSIAVSASASDESSASHYIRDGHKDRVIVFVHGLYGDATESWACKRSPSWQTMMLDDPAFSDADIYVAGFATPRRGNKMTVDEVVASLKNHFDADKVISSHRDIVFVAHSLGGIIVQRYLLTHREVAKKTRFIYFYSTPETGSQLASLAHLFNSDPLLKELVSGDSNDYLQNLEAEWLNASFGNVKRLCAYEKKPIHGILVVGRLSGTRNCQSQLPIAKDHISIVKPCDRQDDAYLALKNAVSDIPILPFDTVLSSGSSSSGASLANLYFVSYGPTLINSADMRPVWYAAGNTFDVNVAYRVRGPGNASSIHSKHRVLIVDTFDTDELIRVGQALVALPAKAGVGGFSVPGEQSFFTAKGETNLTEESITQIIARKMFVVVLIDIEYEDPAGPHYLHKCDIATPFEIDPLRHAPTWGQCGVFNDAR